MSRTRLTPAIVVAEAAQVADEVGFDRLTLAAVAQRLGVALPSLYKHIRNLDALRQQLTTLALSELTTAFTTATIGRAGSDALHALAAAYRDYVHRHPGRYAATLRAPDPTDTAHVAATEAAVAVLFAVLDGYGLSGDHAVDAARFLRSELHGFVTLEVAGGFGLPQDVNRSYHRIINVLDQVLKAWPRGDEQ